MARFTVSQLPPTNIPSGERIFYIILAGYITMGLPVPAAEIAEILDMKEDQVTAIIEADLEFYGTDKTSAGYQPNMDTLIRLEKFQIGG